MHICVFVGLENNKVQEKERVYDLGEGTSPLQKRFVRLFIWSLFDQTDKLTNSKLIPPLAGFPRPVGAQQTGGGPPLKR